MQHWPATGSVGARSMSTAPKVGPGARRAFRGQAEGPSIVLLQWQPSLLIFRVVRAIGWVIGGFAA